MSQNQKGCCPSCHQISDIDEFSKHYQEFTEKRKNVANQDRYQLVNPTGEGDNFVLNEYTFNSFAELMKKCREITLQRWPHAKRCWVREFDYTNKLEYLDHHDLSAICHRAQERMVHRYRLIRYSRVAPMCSCFLSGEKDCYCNNEDIVHEEYRSDQIGDLLSKVTNKSTPIDGSKWDLQEHVDLRWTAWIDPNILLSKSIAKSGLASLRE